MSINSLLRWFLTLLIIVIACVFCYIRYNAYFRNPWTRDGMVQAEVVQVAASYCQYRWAGRSENTRSSGHQ